jgi:predicted double-glycine peptidase
MKPDWFKLVTETIAVATAVVFCLVAMPRSAAAGEISITDDVGYYTVHLTTLKELRFRSVIRQQYDFSCGSAALATLLTYHYGRPTSESSIFTDMWDRGDHEKIRKEGFSMLDMQGYLTRQGLRSNGYQTTIDRLLKADVPGLVLLNVNGFLHFVTLDGIKDGRVLVADPALGIRAMSVNDFQTHWSGVFFVILDDVQDARKTFNSTEDWAVQPIAPVDMVREIQSLSSFMLSLPSANEMRF